MTEKLDDVLEVSTKGGSTTPSGGGVAKAPSRYGNLLAVSGSLRSYGGTLQFLGIIVAIASLFAGYYAGLPFGVAVVVAGIVLAIGLHAMGTFIAATGEGLLAVADIATNTAPKEGRS